jgi:MoxR-like ATPase
VVLHEVSSGDETSEFDLSGGWRDFADVLSAGLDRVILYGPPGTGKTYAALHFATDRATSERLICTEDLTTADVTGCWMPVGEGRWEWLEGPAIRAWRFGTRLVVDEVDRASGDVLSLLLAMTDTEGSSQWRHPHTGEVLMPHRDFSVVMTTNLARLEELPPALRDRLPVAIGIDRPHPASVRGLSRDLRSAALNGSLADEDRRISLRAFYAFDRLRAHCGDERAALLVFGAARAVAFLDVLTISALRP